MERLANGVDLYIVPLSTSESCSSVWLVEQVLILGINTSPRKGGNYAILVTVRRVWCARNP